MNVFLLAAFKSIVCTLMEQVLNVTQDLHFQLSSNRKNILNLTERKKDVKCQFILFVDRQCCSSAGGIFLHWQTKKTQSY
jgi:hypothetical protein